MYYEINISNKKNHYFATAPRSIDSTAKLREIVKHFQTAFPAPEFKMSITKYSMFGEYIDIEDILREKISFHKNSGYAQLYASDTHKMIQTEMFDYPENVIYSVVEKWNKGDDFNDIILYLLNNSELSPEQYSKLIESMKTWIGSNK